MMAFDVVFQPFSAFADLLVAVDDFLRHRQGETVEETPFAFFRFKMDDAARHLQRLVVGADGLHQILFAFLRETFHRIQRDLRAAAECLCLGVGNRLFGTLRQMIDDICSRFIQRNL